MSYIDIIGINGGGFGSFFFYVIVYFKYIMMFFFGFCNNVIFKYIIEEL